MKTKTTMSKKSKTQNVLTYLQRYGYINKTRAHSHFSIFDPPKVVHDLRNQGHNIQTELTRDGVRYKLLKTPENEKQGPKDERTKSQRGITPKSLKKPESPLKTGETIIYFLGGDMTREREGEIIEVDTSTSLGRVYKIRDLQNKDLQCYRSEEAVWQIINV